MTGVELYRRRCEAAQADTIRAMRLLAVRWQVVESMERPALGSLRAYLQEAEHALLAYDKARAALDAAEAMEVSR